VITFKFTSFNNAFWLHKKINNLDLKFLQIINIEEFICGKNLNKIEVVLDYLQDFYILNIMKASNSFLDILLY